MYSRLLNESIHWNLLMDYTKSAIHNQGCLEVLDLPAAVMVDIRLDCSQHNTNLYVKIDKGLVCRIEERHGI